MPLHTVSPPRGETPSKLGKVCKAFPVRPLRVGWEGWCAHSRIRRYVIAMRGRKLRICGSGHHVPMKRTCEGRQHLGRPRGGPIEHCSPAPRPMRRPKPTRGTPRYARLRRLRRAGRQVAPHRTASNLQLCAPTHRQPVSRACRAREAAVGPAREVGRHERGLGKGLSRPDPPSPLSPV